MQALDWFQRLACPALELRYADGSITRFNTLARRLFGAGGSAIGNRPILDLLVVGDGEYRWSMLHHALNVEGGFCADNAHVRTVSGELLAVSLSASAIDTGEERRVLLLLHPVTAVQHLMRGALREDVIRTAAPALYRLDAAGRLSDANAMLASLLGYGSVGELIERGVRFRDGLYAQPEQRRELQSVLARDGRVRYLKVEIFRRDGSRLWAVENVRAVRDGRGQKVAEVGTLARIPSLIANVRLPEQN